MMRPIVKAVGLICILAHDYLIVKIKVLFRDPVAVVDHKLSVDAAPVLTATGPFFRDVLHSKIQHFEKAVICRKYGLCFGDLLQLAVKTLSERTAPLLTYSKKRLVGTPFSNRSYSRAS